MADAGHGRARRVGGQRGAQIVELARGLDDVEAGGPDKGHARRVVTAVLQAPQAVHEDVSERSDGV